MEGLDFYSCIKDGFKQFPAESSNSEVHSVESFHPDIARRIDSETVVAVHDETIDNLTYFYEVSIGFFERLVKRADCEIDLADLCFKIISAFFTNELICS